MDAARKRRIETSWGLRRRSARLHAEFDFLTREVKQLSQKRFLKPPVESIELTEAEEKFLNELKERKLREVITKHCLGVVKFLTNQKYLSYPFNEPVDTVTYRDYLNYVRTPMDFGTVKGKIAQYKTPSEFETDVRLVFENARKYNAPETDVREMARLLELKFDEKWTKTVLPRIEELATAEMEDRIAFKQTKAENVIVEAETRVDECCRLLLNRLQTLTDDIKHLQCLAATQCQALTETEQLRLGWELTALPLEQFQHAVNLVLLRHPGLIATMRDNTIDFDLNKMDSLTLRQLQDLIKFCRKEREKSEDDCVQEASVMRKRLRSSNPSNGNSESAEASSSCIARDHGVEWPTAAFGVGLKPYAAEVEAFVPPNTEDASALQFPSVGVNTSYSCVSTEKETPESTSAIGASVDDTVYRARVPRSAPSSKLTTPLPQNPTIKSKTVYPEGLEEVQGTNELLTPSVFSLASIESCGMDAMTPSLSTSRGPSLGAECDQSGSELTPPIVRVSTAGLAAIPLIPASQPTGLFPSFFTANIQPRMPLASAPALPHTMSTLTTSYSLPVVFPESTGALSQPLTTTAFPHIIDLTKMPSSSRE